MVGYRKFALSVLALLGNFLLKWQGTIGDDVYMVTTIAVVGGFGLGNVGEWWSKRGMGAVLSGRPARASSAPSSNPATARSAEATP